MTLFVDLIPAFQDNYFFFLKDEKTEQTAVVDPGSAATVLDYLDHHKLSLDYIFNTHHHWDHTGGNAKLKSLQNCTIIGPAGEQDKIPCLDQPVQENDVVSLGETSFQIFDVPGHTAGHIAYYDETNKNLFCGDTLFAMGCGRLFEGTAEQMFNSLQKLSSLPDETEIYCAHEYTLSNGEFALTVESDNHDLITRVDQVRTDRQQNKPTIPSTLEQEKKTNPFLRAQNIKDFAHIRTLKDNF